MLATDSIRSSMSTQAAGCMQAKGAARVQHSHIFQHSNDNPLVNPGASGSAGPFSENVVRVCLQAVYSCTASRRQHVAAGLHSSKCQCQ